MQQINSPRIRELGQPRIVTAIDRGAVSLSEGSGLRPPSKGQAAWIAARDVLVEVGAGVASWIV